MDGWMDGWIDCSFVRSFSACLFWRSLAFGRLSIVRSLTGPPCLSQMSGGIVPTGDGGPHYDVEFSLVMFRPIKVRARVRLLAWRKAKGIG